MLLNVLLFLPAGCFLYKPEHPAVAGWPHRLMVTVVAARILSMTLPLFYCAHDGHVGRELLWATVVVPATVILGVFEHCCAPRVKCHGQTRRAGLLVALFVHLSRPSWRVPESSSRRPSRSTVGIAWQRASATAVPYLAG
jgi:hypothetical protein